MLKAKLGCLFIALLVMSLPAAADSTSDVFTVFNATGAIVGQVGVTQDGAIFGLNAACFSFSISPCNPNAEDPNVFYYINDQTLPDSSQWGFATTLCDSLPCAYNTTTLSDVYGVANLAVATGGTFLVLGFGSDNDVTIPGLGPQGRTFVLEHNGTFDATTYLAPSLQSAGYTATFQSDFEAPVPEPSSLLLLGSGLLALGFMFKKA